MDFLSLLIVARATALKSHRMRPASAKSPHSKKIVLERALSL
jgi:hypothetical protein